MRFKLPFIGILSLLALAHAVDIVEYVDDDRDLEDLDDYLEDTGLDDLLDGGSYTLLAPTDSAFDDLDGDLEDLLDESEIHLENLLNYHILRGRLSTFSLQGRVEYTRNGERVRFDSGTPLEIEDVNDNNSEVEQPNIWCDNGYIHTIDRVLLPRWAGMTIWDIVEEHDDLSYTKEMFESADLEDDIDDDDLMTLLAPTDRAWRNFFNSNGMRNFLTSSNGEDMLKDILRYHILEGVYSEEDMADEDEISTEQGGDVEIESRSSNQVRRVNDAYMGESNIMARNGFVHKIDRVLNPNSGLAFDGTIAELLEDDEDYGDLDDMQELVERAGLEDFYDDYGRSMTLFAFTDDAFDELSSNTRHVLSDNDAFMPHLRNLLMYHTLPQEVYTSDVARYMADNGDCDSSDSSDDSCDWERSAALMTANDEPMVFDETPFEILGLANEDTIQLEVTDIQTDNGVVHIIDEMLIMPTWTGMTLKDRLETDPELSMSYTLASMNEDFMDSIDEKYDELTFLVPTNDAWNNMPETTLNLLMAPENVEQLSNVLSYHVLNAIMCADDCRREDQAMLTLQGGNVMVHSDPLVVGNVVLGHSLMFDNAHVVEEDILANNGIMHKIDGVLSPPGVTI